MNPAEEKARLHMVQAALEELLTGKPKTRTELFGEAGNDAVKQFQRRIIKALEQYGAIVRTELGSVTNINMKNRKKVEYLLSNEVELVRLIWPGSTVPAEEPAVFITVKPVAPQLKVVEPVVLEVVETAPQGPEAQLPAPVSLTGAIPDATTQALLEKNNALLEQLLLILDAATQSIIYTREKVDAMEVKLNTIWEQWK